MPANIQRIACAYVARCTARQCEGRAMAHAALIDWRAEVEALPQVLLRSAAIAVIRIPLEMMK
jgi:hypothetical protein